MKRTGLLIALLALAVGGLPAYAQDNPPDRPGGGMGRPRAPQQFQRLTPEKAEAAWKLQARGVARGLTLNEEGTAKMIEAYVKARKSYAEAVQKLREEWQNDPDRPRRGEGDPGERRGRGDRGARGGQAGEAGQGAAGGRGGRGGRGAGAAGGEDGMGAAGGPPDRPDDDARQVNREKMQELLESEQEKLETDLAMFLAGDQLKYASYLLGSFNNTWDVMVDTIAGFKLDREKTFQALKHIEAYIAETTKLRGSGERGANMRQMQEARQKLDKALSSILDERQMARFRRSGGGRGTAAGRTPFNFDELDKNGDGKISKDEFPERMQRIFDRLDTNGDGVIDKEELEAIGAGRGGRGGDAGGFGGRRGGGGGGGRSGG